MAEDRETNAGASGAAWGAMLLAKSDYDGAIAKLESANKKGPHFADPLEMWGEALFWTGDKDGAKAQFALAARLDLSVADRAELSRNEAGHV
jgi:predicted negative regulator of RcsB-dependent stress response